MNDSSRAIPNVHVPENEKVLSYLKELHPFKEIILPFASGRVSQDVTPADFVGRFAAMASLPENSKYVVYGSEALVHPETGMIFGFITGTSVIYRMPDTLLQELRQNHISNIRAVNDLGGNGMENLEDNWISSPSITEQLVRKCYEYYGQVTSEPEEMHLNFELDLTTPRTREFEQQEQSRRLLPLGVIVVVCVIGVLLLYAANYVMKLF